MVSRPYDLGRAYRGAAGFRTLPPLSVQNRAFWGRKVTQNTGTTSDFVVRLLPLNSDPWDFHPRPNSQVTNLFAELD